MSRDYLFTVDHKCHKSKITKQTNLLIHWHDQELTASLKGAKKCASEITKPVERDIYARLYYMAGCINENVVNKFLYLRTSKTDITQVPTYMIQPDAKK